MSATGAKEGNEPSSYTQVLLACNRIETKLESLMGPKGRLDNIENDIKAHGQMLADHEKKIQRAHGALGVLIVLWGGLEAYFHKLLGK